MLFGAVFPRFLRDVWDEAFLILLLAMVGGVLSMTVVLAPLVLMAHAMLAWRIVNGYAVSWRDWVNGARQHWLFGYTWAFIVLAVVMILLAPPPGVAQQPVCRFTCSRVYAHALALCGIGFARRLSAHSATGGHCPFVAVSGKWASHPRPTRTTRSQPYRQKWGAFLIAPRSLLLLPLIGCRLPIGDRTHPANSHTTSRTPATGLQAVRDDSASRGNTPARLQKRLHRLSAHAMPGKTTPL